MKGRTSILGLVLLLSALIMSGCVTVVEGATAQEVVRGSGTVVTEDRPVSDFNRISLSGAGQVTITQGDSEALTVETDDNIMGYIKAEVKNGTLVLGFTEEARRKNFRPSEGINFLVSLKELTDLHLSGAGDITAESLEADRLKIHLSGAGNVRVDSLTADELVVRLSGAGDFKLAGQVLEQDVLVSGAGAYHAAELEGEMTTVTISGAGSATVWATESLDATISGVGNVEYYGSPSVIKHLSGLGRLVSRGDH